MLGLTLPGDSYGPRNFSLPTQGGRSLLVVQGRPKARFLYSKKGTFALSREGSLLAIQGALKDWSPQDAGEFPAIETKSKKVRGSDCESAHSINSSRGAASKRRL